MIAAVTSFLRTVCDALFLMTGGLNSTSWPDGVMPGGRGDDTLLFAEDSR